MAALKAAFEVFHEANPRVYPLVCRFAAEAISRGFTQYGISPIWERVRWEINMTNRSNIDAEDFKMPNNHRAYYARLWLKDHPQYDGEHPFFRTAELRSLREPDRNTDHYGRSREEHP